MSATITTKASAKGYQKAWAYGAGEPGTAFMNYTNSFLVATGYAPNVVVLADPTGVSP